MDDGTIVLYIFDTPSKWSRWGDEDDALFENNEDEKHIKELDKKISELENQVNELKQLIIGYLTKMIMEQKLIFNNKTKHND